MIPGASQPRCVPLWLPRAEEMLTVSTAPGRCEERVTMPVAITVHQCRGREETGEQKLWWPHLRDGVEGGKGQHRSTAGGEGEVGLDTRGTLGTSQGLLWL